jgi:C4-dicarboxylate-specific signal transduction histidine kinase
MTNDLSSPLLRSIFNVASEGILVVDHESRKILEYNTRFLELWKIPEHIALKKDDHLLLKLVIDQIENSESFLSLVADLYTSPERSSLDVLVLKDQVFFERRSEPLILDGAVKGRVWFFRDVSQVKRAFKELAHQRSILQSIISATPHAILWKNLDFEVIGCNEMFAKTVSLDSPDQVIGRSDLEFLENAETADLVRKKDEEVLRTGIPQIQVDEVIEDKGLTYYINISRIPLKNQAGEIFGILTVFTDQTEIKENEKLLKEKEAMLVHASQLSSLGEMAAGIAHEINNPLAIIKASVRYLNKLLDKNNLDPNAFKESCIEINTTVDRIAAIIVGLKNISRRNDRIDHALFSYEDIFKDVFSVAQERFKQNDIELRRSFTEDESKVLFKGNRIQISQVLVNLLNNSFDALESFKSGKKWIDFRIDTTHELIILKVTDSGAGIPPEIRKDIFRPFYTTKDIGKGTGIGLSISKSIIENAGGKFYYDETSPHTAFVIELKRAG